MAIISSIAMWFSTNHGTIAINWLGWEVKTSISIFVFTLVFIFFIFSFVIISMIKIILLPKKIKNNIKNLKIKEARNAMYDGLIASSYGNANVVNKKFELSKRVLQHNPIFLLLSLQNYIAMKNEAQCFNTLSKMLEYNSTKPLAIKGLINIAQSNNDSELFVNMLKKSKEYKISIKWIIQEALNFCIHNGSWELLAGFLNDKLYKKHNSILHILSLIHLYMSNEFLKKGLLSEAKEYILKAYKVNSSFPPIIEMYCKLNISKSNRDLIKKLKKYWYDCPHPNIINCLENGLKSNDPKVAIRNLDIIFNKSNSHLRYLILGELKYKAKVYGEAKSDLKKSVNIKPTKRAYESLLEIEKSLSNNPIELEKWKSLIPKTKDELKWKCKSCGDRQLTWNIYCRNCKLFDGLVWASNQSDFKNKSIVQNNPSFRIGL